MTFRLPVLAFATALVLGAVPASLLAAAPAKSPAKLTLQKIDIKPGSGKLAMNGSTVSIHYTGYLYAPKASRLRGPQFDSSGDSLPFTFKLGAGAVIKGWDEGVRGMKVGGKRTLIVPAALGFGKEGLGPVPQNANLIFDIELVDVK